MLREFLETHSFFHDQDQMSLFVVTIGLDQLTLPMFIVTEGQLPSEILLVYKGYLLALAGGTSVA